MKRKSILATSCAAALFLTGAAWGQNSATVIDTERLDDKNVVNMQGEELGEIERLLIDPQTGNVKYAVLEVGGFLGIGDTEVAVPWKALQVTGKGAGDFDLRLNATKEKLEKAPRFSSNEADRLFTPAGAEPITQYWAVIITDPLRQNQQQQQSGTASTPRMPGEQPQSTTGGGFAAPGSQPNVTTPGTNEINRNLNQAPGSPNTLQQNQPSTSTPPQGNSSGKSGATGWDQQFQQDKSGTPGKQNTQPNTSTPENQSSSTPGAYYQQNRERTNSSASDRNNQPAGTRPSDGSISGPGDSPVRSGEPSAPANTPQSNSGLGTQPSDPTIKTDEPSTPQ